MQPITDLFLDGEKKGHRYIVYVTYLGDVNAREVLLTGKCFFYLAKLAVARGNGQGWIHRNEIEPEGNQSQWIYRLKQDLGIEIEADRRSNYRLTISPKVIRFKDELKHFDDARVRGLFEEVV